MKNNDRIQATMSLSRGETDDDKINLLKFILAKYNLEGDFLGFEELDSQLLLCSNTYDDQIDSRRFGVTMILQCDIDL